MSNDRGPKTHETICIECRYQCSHRCSWAWEFVPVPGWTAVENRRGYDVYACPNFAKGRGLPRSGFDTEGVICCLQALMEATRDDYILGRDLHVADDGRTKKSKYQPRLSMAEKLDEAAKTRAGNRRNIENWIRGDGQKLLMLSDPEAVIQQLRKFARKYEQERVAMIRRMMP